MVTWYEYTNLLDKLFNEVRLKNFDNILAIGRGGAVIAAYLSSKMGLPTFCPVFVRHQGEGGDVRMILHDWCQINSVRGRTLIVDDWLDHGRAMNFVLERIPKETTITTLVMYNRRGSEFKPDIVGEYIEETEREIIFPYDLP